MRAVVQRVTRAQVQVAGETIAAIGAGLLVLVGIEQVDDLQQALWLADKIGRLRVFSDHSGRFADSVVDCGGSCLVVSQFTLFASTKKGTRPGLNRAAAPALALPLYRAFCDRLSDQLGQPVSEGRFGADMQVDLCNDGPVTLIIDSLNRE